MNMRESIALMIQQFAAEKPETAAMIVNDETCTYAQLASANRKAARWLQEKGICPGDRIIVEADHILDYVYFWYGLQLLGATFVPVEKDTPSNRILEIAEELQTGYMVTLKAREDLPQGWSLADIMPEILALSDDFQPQIPDPDTGCLCFQRRRRCP
jgi:acyl-CoA synthetase (AMP-forming)/AMP-acid ligase II